MADFDFAKAFAELAQELAKPPEDVGGMTVFLPRNGRGDDAGVTVKLYDLKTAEVERAT